MTEYDLLVFALYLGAVLLLTRPLGAYIARVYQGEATLAGRLLGPIERFLYRLLGTRESEEMHWTTYARSFLLFNLLGFLAVYGLQRLQAVLPLDSDRAVAVTPDLAFNTAASFVSNTNWQSYSGEVALGYLVQMAGLTVQNFVSAAGGMAVLAAFVRGLVRHTSRGVGNFWVDLVRGILYILLPLSVVFALLLVSQGVVQTLHRSEVANLVQPVQSAGGGAVSEQTIAVGPAASQIAVKQLGTNGGGFFGTNSAHPFENPTPVSNFLELLAILLIPASLTYTFGRMVRDQRQGWVLFAVMTVLFVAVLSVNTWAETRGNPTLESAGVAHAASTEQPGGNMEGKEVRNGPAMSALWATATTAASSGSVDSMHDSLMPLAGMGAMWLMQLGEVVYGGVGSGLYGMLAFVIVAVFVAGLMVGRTPEYLGKKVETYEMKMAALIVLIPPITVLVGTALAVSVPGAREAVLNPGPHGFSEVLYAFSSAGNNNGSAFAGLSSNTPFYNTTLGIAMLVGRYWLALPALAIAGSFAAKKKVPPSAGTLPTHTPLFAAWLLAVVVIVGALSFLPALTLGPIVEQLLIQ
ncbi:MAG: potassium-transporting ATPase subunit KdpA [Thermoleophilia bacterium]|nr:potassium-transporting ATPase subunit KdpA [Thermoleophilia bacterium]